MYAEAFSYTCNTAMLSLCGICKLCAKQHILVSTALPDAVPRYQPQLRPVLEEDVARCLRWVDPHAICRTILMRNVKSGYVRLRPLQNSAALFWAFPAGSPFVMMALVAAGTLNCDSSSGISAPRHQGCDCPCPVLIDVQSASCNIPLPQRILARL